MRRKITLMVVPEGGDKVYSRTLPSSLLKALFVLLCLMMIFMVGVTTVYSRLVFRAARSAMLEEENQRLRAYFARVVDIEESFKKNQELTARLAEMAGIDLQELRGPARINFDSLGNSSAPHSPYDRTNASQPNPASLMPDQLAQQRVPSGQPLYGYITKRFSAIPADKHRGVDFAVKEETAVMATASGEVVSAGYDNDLGYLVVIDHGNGFLTSYGHNNKILAQKGDKVYKGDVIALSGNTGNSSAPHLHYEVIKDGAPVDPTPYLE